MLRGFAGEAFFSFADRRCPVLFVDNSSQLRGIFYAVSDVSPRCSDEVCDVEPEYWDAGGATVENGAGEFVQAVHSKAVLEVDGADADYGVVGDGFAVRECGGDFE